MWSTWAGVSPSASLYVFDGYQWLRDGIPMNSFEVDDVDAEHRRLRERGVEFARPPSDAGPVRIAVFADTCGNLIQIHARRRAG